MADPSRLQQIINNLLTNAIKFSDEYGKITVTTKSTGGSGLLIVSDSGIGIDAEFLPHVFEKFRQADSSARRRHGGLGLGLSIVKSLVEMQGGEVSVFSEGSGRGATFTVQLPLAILSEEASTEPSESDFFQSTPHPDNSALGARLLVIEDDPDTLEMMKVLCEAQRIKVIGARTAEDAFEMLNGDRPDIIISDISLPGMDGHELARRLRADDRLGAIPMIAITGLVSDDDRNLALDAGFDAHLPKPINYGKLFDLIRQLTKPRVASDSKLG
jgi:CheY-like chemotaxis protein/anti-sigma regulatory factor (Ser/Thr protein kinase)